ncbi:MAG: HAMP domain-containing histidine kinase [Firmicutes bacterium]|nr:HAMP domain-containing histidine kinase [Bacillota bacterium]MCL2255854.1 HAMP domain-containing histidine kinase [Bacillota bacterium]
MKIFSNFIFRWIVCCVTIVLTAVLPLYFILLSIDSGHVVVLVLTLVLQVGLIFLIVWLNFRTIVRPIRRINKDLKNLVKGGYVENSFKGIDSEVEKLTKNLNKAAAEFDSVEQMRKTFVSNASHELRSPLTSMQGFLQAILDGTISEDDDKEKYIRIVLRETKRLGALINSMLDLSRLESGKNPVVPSRFEINDVMATIIERLTVSLQKKQIKCVFEPIREHSYVYADKDKIIQVIINLIDNAIKYSPVSSRILVTTHFHSNKLCIVVKDNGYGIAKKDLKSIWDRFYMADKARTPNQAKGTGLGLAIVKQIIDDHGETIWAESTRGVGTTFIFTLPMFDPNKHGKKSE